MVSYKSHFVSVVVASTAKVYKTELKNGESRVIMEYRGYINGAEKPSTIREIRLPENEAAATEKAKKYRKGFKTAVKIVGETTWSNQHAYGRLETTWYGYGMKK